MSRLRIVDQIHHKRFEKKKKKFFSGTFIDTADHIILFRELEFYGVRKSLNGSKII